MSHSLSWLAPPPIRIVETTTGSTWPACRRELDRGGQERGEFGDVHPSMVPGGRRPQGGRHPG
ncbi:hypothetical protein ACWGH8_20115 [Nonomuraea muscovyensis]